MENIKLTELIERKEVHELVEHKDHLALAKFLGRELCDFKRQTRDILISSGTLPSTKAGCT
jgi:hypothetical protein